MNDKFRQNEQGKDGVGTAKECTYLALFVALVIAAQLAFAAIPGVEVVTLLFVVYSFVFGARRGMLSATAFSCLRQIVFGVYFNVLALYLIYYNLLCLIFGLLGRKGAAGGKRWISLTVIACIATAFFTLLDNILTILWNGFSARVARVYIYASLPVMFSQCVCTILTMAIFFLPLQRAFYIIKKGR